MRRSAKLRNRLISFSFPFNLLFSFFPLQCFYSFYYTLTVLSFFLSFLCNDFFLPFARFYPPLLIVLLFDQPSIVVLVAQSLERQIAAQTSGVQSQVVTFLLFFSTFVYFFLLYKLFFLIEFNILFCQRPRQIEEKDVHNSCSMFILWKKAYYGKWYSHVI